MFRRLWLIPQLAPTQSSTQIPLLGGVDPAGPRFGVSPPKIKFYIANPPRGAIFVCWPPPNSQHIQPHLVKWTLRGPGLGEPPKNKFFYGKPTSKSNFCLLVPAQFLTLQGISDGVSMGGTPGGQQFGSPPGSVLSPGEMRSPCQILGWWLVWARRQAAGHTNTHTHTHTFMFIY